MWALRAGFAYSVPGFPQAIRRKKLSERLAHSSQRKRFECSRPAADSRWRSDRVLRRLEAMLLVLDHKSTFLLSGNGDLIEPDDGIIGIGSGGGYAMAAARALARDTDLDARAIAEQAMAIAADICIYTNASITIEEL